MAQALLDNFQMPPYLPKNLEKMTFDDLHIYLSNILKKHLTKTGQIGKGTGLKFSWGNPQLRIP